MTAADPRAPAGAEAVRAAITAARRGSDTSRWPDKLPVADRLTALLDPGSWREDGLLANAGAAGLPADGFSDEDVQNLKYAAAVLDAGLVVQRGRGRNAGYVAGDDLRASATI